MVIITFFIIHWYASFFLQSFFYHRYTAHRHFYMSVSTERFFYILSFLIHGSSYMSPFTYGVMHRMHHMHTDTESDPHSPTFHPGLWGTLVQTRNSYHHLHTGITKYDIKLGKDLPTWDAFEKFAHNWITRVAWIFLYIIFYAFFVTAWWMWLLLPLTITMSSFQGALINWWAHRFGYVNYPMNNTSTNILPIDPIFIGDAYHNNHHQFPGRANNAHRWFEFDLIFYITVLLGKLRIISWNEK